MEALTGESMNIPSGWEDGGQWKGTDWEFLFSQLSDEDAVAQMDRIRLCIENGVVYTTEIKVVRAALEKEGKEISQQDVIFAIMSMKASQLDWWIARSIARG
ncbi:hypothetical protein C5B42_03130 [Candidatus Cerribacteria bacterium 'Amazon FNV 2010 28 9']|uniref:Uncharacterized protein n=1 Tax=Candidatus Cerribacteria bacterium 'Amazon FNV 2010 28 9' TaxID=2081795 RepID=A0A317JQ46_9BACT|nr:MAG: hypothetical protein C5B42_03130 [Candidatus Cerribacteria bacterium 'Amazon FNV 2010 28 9']